MDRPVQRTRKRRGGFTLVELMTCLVIMSVIAGMAFPRFAEARRAMSLDSAAQQLMRDLHLAQTEATKRNQTVSVRWLASDQYQIDSLAVRELDKGVRFATGTPLIVSFASFGPLVTGAATFDLELGTHHKRVHVNAAGFVTLQ